MPSKQPTLNKIDILAAGILWLAGQGFLLLPARMSPIAADFPSWLIALMGGGCILAAMLVLIATFVAVSPHLRWLLVSLALLAVGLLGFLFFQAGLYPEALLISSVCIAGLASYASRSATRPISEKHLILPVILVNLSVGVLLLANLAHPPLQAAINPQLFRFVQASVFLASGLLGAFRLVSSEARLFPLGQPFLALPWLIWGLLYIPDLGLPHLIAPTPFVVLLLLGPDFPWNQFVLPTGDRIGRRIALVSCLALFLIIGSMAFHLNVLERTTGPMQGAPAFSSIPEWTFVAFTFITALMFYAVSAIAMTVHNLMAPQADAKGVSNTIPQSSLWGQRVARYLQPFSLTREGLRGQLEVQAEQIGALSRQLEQERRRTEQLVILNELRQQLDANLDPPVASQLVASMLERAMPCTFVCLYLHDPENKEFVALATAGRTAQRPVPGYRQKNDQGVLGRLTRSRKTQIITDTRHDPNYLPVPGASRNPTLSYIAVPLLQTGMLKGAIELESEALDFFGSSDVEMVERLADELVSAWERSSYHARLMDLIQAGISLSTMVEQEATVRELANIAKHSLEARFTYISLLFDREEKLVQKAHYGYAPRLLRSLEADTSQASLLKASLNAAQPFRVRDVRKYPSHGGIELDENNLRSMLAVPIRLHGLNIGAILAFGKQKEAFFTENDESLASLLASQAAAAIESVWLQQELRATLRTTRLLYELSYHIIQAEELSEAAQHIATAAHRLVQADITGIVLFKNDGSMATRIQVDADGPHNGGSHPMETIEEVMHTGRMLYQSIETNASRLCLPIQTPARKHGALWLKIPEQRGYKSGSPADLQTLTNQAALALERAILIVESRQQAKEIESAFHELELAYDRTLAGLISTLDARDRETEGHSTRVSMLTRQLGFALGLTSQQLKALERGALLHDIGKIGISDDILHKSGPLSELEWRHMRMHPSIGARIIEGIPFLEDSLPVILSHHERWDGSGYPKGLKGSKIPYLARIFSVVDAYDALTTDRPYRARIAAADAMAYIRAQAGSLFDPAVVERFAQLVRETTIDRVVQDQPR